MLTTNHGLDRGLAKRLISRREEAKLSQEKLARMTGLSKNSIQNFEAGKLPTSASLKAICQALNVSADWLLFGEDQQVGASIRDDSFRVSEVVSSSVIQSGRLTPSARPVIPLAQDLNVAEAYDYALVPLTENHISGGHGAFIQSERTSKFLAFRKDWLNNYATSRENVLLMMVEGESMAPSILDGDLVMLDTGRRMIHDGCIYGIGIGEPISIKRLELLVGGRARVISDNRLEYPPYEVDLADLRIFGQIIWYARELLRR